MEREAKRNGITAAIAAPIAEQTPAGAVIIGIRDMYPCIAGCATRVVKIKNTGRRGGAGALVIALAIIGGGQAQGRATGRGDVIQTATIHGVRLPVGAGAGRDGVTVFRAGIHVQADIGEVTAKCVLGKQATKVEGGITHVAITIRRNHQPSCIQCHTIQVEGVDGDVHIGECRLGAITWRTAEAVDIQHGAHIDGAIGKVTQRRCTRAGVDGDTRTQIRGDATWVMDGRQVPFTGFIGHRGIFHKRRGKATPGATIVLGNVSSAAYTASRLRLEGKVDIELFIQVTEGITAATGGMAVTAIQQRVTGQAKVIGSETANRSTGIQRRVADRFAKVTTGWQGGGEGKCAHFIHGLSADGVFTSITCADIKTRDCQGAFGDIGGDIIMAQG